MSCLHGCELIGAHAAEGFDLVCETLWRIGQAVAAVHAERCWSERAEHQTASQFGPLLEIRLYTGRTGEEKGCCMAGKFLRAAAPGTIGFYTGVQFLG